MCSKISSACKHCLVEFPNSDLSSHMLECPAEIIDCPASHFGCSFTSTRAELDPHTNTCHFIALTPVLQLHTERIDALELENRAIRQRLELLTPPRPLPTSSNQTAPPSDAERPPRDITSEMQDYTYHIYSEYEQLRADVERINAQIREYDIRQDVARINEGLRYNEEMTGMRAAINGLRMQLHWLLSSRRDGPVVGAVGPTGGATRSVAGSSAGGAADNRRMSGKS